MFMTSYPVYMISPILLSWQRKVYTWHFTHYVWHHSHCISVLTLAVSMTSQQVWKTSHLAYVWHHTHFTWNHIDNLWYQCSVFWPQNHYIWHPIHVISVNTSTILMISHQLYWWDLIHYIWWHHIHCIQQHIHYICSITTTVSVSHTHSFPWYHTFYIYDLTPTICVTSYTLYKASRPQLMTSHLIIYDITCTVLMTSLPHYLILNPLYLCHQKPSIYDLWPAVCMASHPVYIWHLMHHT